MMFIVRGEHFPARGRRCLVVPLQRPALEAVAEHDLLDDDLPRNLTCRTGLRVGSVVRLRVRYAAEHGTRGGRLLVPELHEQRLFVHPAPPLSSGRAPSAGSRPSGYLCALIAASRSLTETQQVEVRRSSSSACDTECTMAKRLA